MQAENLADEIGLLRDLLSGKPQACRQIDSYIRKVVGFGFRRLQPADVDDVVQFSLLKLYEQASEPDFRLKRSLYGLVRRIAVRRCIDLTRRRREYVDCVDELLTASPSPLAELDLKNQVDRLRVAICRLDLKCRELIRARSLDGTSYHELATRYGKSASRVRGMHLECIQKLRRMLLHLNDTAMQPGRPSRTGP